MIYPRFIARLGRGLDAIMKNSEGVWRYICIRAPLSLSAKFHIVSVGEQFSETILERTVGSNRFDGNHRLLGKPR